MESERERGRERGGPFASFSAVGCSTAVASAGPQAGRQAHATPPAPRDCVRASVDDKESVVVVVVILVTQLAT